MRFSVIDAKWWKLREPREFREVMARPPHSFCHPIKSRLSAVFADYPPGS